MSIPQVNKQRGQALIVRNKADVTKAIKGVYEI